MIKKNHSDNSANETKKFNALKDLPKKPKKDGWKRVLSIVLTSLLTVMLILFITGLSCGVIFAIYIRTDVVDDDFDISNLKLGLDQTTKIYYTDENGEAIELEDQRLYSSENRSWVSVQNMPANLKNAFIAIEDKRFYSHPGIDIKRTLGATATFLVTGNKDYGGSTITQQLIKNITKDNDSTIQRKIREIFRALTLTKKRSKDEILEMYLNTIQLSYSSCYGVQSASNYYFDKDVSELTLAECACLASIPKSPTYYDPIRNPENNLARRTLVLDEMLANGWITEEEHDEAKDAELVFKIGENTVSTTTNSYFTDALIEELISDLEEKYGYPRNIASDLIFSGGLQIYATVDPRIQDIMEEVFEDPASFPTYEGVQPESAMMVMDPYTGDVRGIVGGRGEKIGNRSLNRATQSKRQIGSSIKPISVYAPAVDLGYINFATVIDDTPVKLNANGSYWPKNAPRVYDGKVTIDYAILKSKNTIAVKVLEMLTPEYSYNFLKDKLGITTLVESDKNLAPLALGGLTYGLTVKEVTAAYSIFANDGIYSSPRFYTKVLDNEGNVILEKGEQHEIAISEATAQVMTKMMQDVVKKGTGTGVTLKSKIDVAGKTGTTDDNKDLYFAGYTPYYVGACWFGFDIPKYLGNVSNPALHAWDLVMTKIHEPIIADAKAGNSSLKKFSSDELVEAKYCKDSGLAPSDNCELDLRGSRIETGWFKKGTEPKKKCDVHVKVKWDTVSMAVANSACPVEQVKEVSLVRETNRKFFYQVPITDAQYTYRDIGNTEYCTEPGEPFYGNTLIDWVANEEGEEFYQRYAVGTSGVTYPANRYCTDHIPSKKTDEPEKTGGSDKTDEGTSTGEDKQDTEEETEPDTDRNKENEKPDEDADDQTVEKKEEENGSDDNKGEED